MRSLRKMICAPKAILFGLLAVFGLVGCSTDDNGDVQSANKAAELAPKSVSELPSQMPPEVQRGAASAMGQAKRCNSK